MTDFELLCKRLRHISLTKPHRSKRFMSFVRKEGETFHHVFGSVHGMKSSDLCGMSLDGVKHSLKQDRKIEVEDVVAVVQNLIQYVEKLENGG